MPAVFAVAVAALATIVGLGVPPVAAPTTSSPRPVRPCAELAGDLRAPGAAAHVTSATVTAATGDAPEYCDVRGYVEGTIQFRLQLPTKTYGGRYLQYGCSGFCGELTAPVFPECGGIPGRDVAVATTDDGHVGHTTFRWVDGRWAADDQAARDNWSFRAPHAVSVVAKRVIARYYGAPPRTSYFSGCSNGGREAMLLAQRYPHDFDGLIARGPAHAVGALLGVYETWVARSNTGPDGAPIITAQKLPALHDAALAACDSGDGLVDGQIDDPRACRFDPSTIACQGAELPGCLTPTQVEAARRLYTGPTDAAGRRLYPGGQPVGSELAWDGWIIPKPSYGGAFNIMLADNYLRYAGYPIGTPHSSIEDFDFSVEEFDRLTAEAVKGNAMNTDLSEFRRAGGKLIMWHGWSDQVIPPVGTLDYYQRLWQRDGGLHATQQYARVFMVPGAYHCLGGDRLNEFDPFPALIRWVEKGAAPQSITAQFRDQAGAVQRTRPVFAYPTRARYDGTGSIDDARNFVPAPPARPLADVISWAGDNQHHVPGPVAP
ncbi:feruloyl esterase [Virgisporangium aliadipatigenens]|uniref:Feruloyl esterase n=1 Tax=Virgisporangium aliadipatigenens TaxID=741659 RepID=A0A8J3YV10_9ACTN|nr:tannase/feruloyl esterase family alpha/beta hydrolase [Virgisporangium aliadipatigenens]GIJ50355.1 feruloyl esterase [Virgisporangium aliadipatigenens]